MELHHLPVRTSDAAGNMAVDHLLLRRHPHPDAIRFRHYAWRRPAVTFGYGQKIAFVRAQVPGIEALDLARRATGGGIVDHRDDWTYALVLPRAHPLFDRPGPVIYRVIHTALAEALTSLGAEVRLQEDPPEVAPGVCFARAELDDVVLAADGRKVAGAALKRDKHGLLLQGSLARTLLPEPAWDALEEAFAARLAATLAAGECFPGWPAFDPDEEEALVDQYGSEAWLEAR